MQLILPLFAAAGLTLLYGLLRSSGFQIGKVPVAELFTVGMGFYLALLGMSVASIRLQGKRKFVQRTEYYPSGRIFRQSLYDARSRRLLLMEEYDETTGRVLKSERYDS